MRIHLTSPLHLRLRVLFCLVLAMIAATMNMRGLESTAAYFTSSTTTAASTMSTVRLDVSTSPSTSGVFDVAANMLPGDFQVKAMDLVNNGVSGTTQQDFTYSLTSTSTGAGDTCSLLDSSNPPTCSTPSAPSAASTTGAALLLLRCTADTAATIPLACGTQNVYVTQVYPAAGAGTQQQLTNAGGLARAAITGVASGGSYSIGIGGRGFTGGALIVASAFGIGGPDSVTGADGQLNGLAAGRTDHLASVVYLPSQAGDALANQTSVLTFTWSATQRLGSTRS